LLDFSPLDYCVWYDTWILYTQKLTNIIELKTVVDMEWFATGVHW